jgi:hypothetical protein
LIEDLQRQCGQCVMKRSTSTFSILAVLSLSGSPQARATHGIAQGAEHGLARHREMDPRTVAGGKVFAGAP